MVWIIEFEETAKKEFQKLDKQSQKILSDYLKTRIATEESPYRFGEALRENLSGLWKYRIGNYRILAEIQDARFIVLVLKTCHRSKVYGGH